MPTTHRWSWIRRGGLRIGILLAALLPAAASRSGAAGIQFLPNPGFVCDTLVVHAVVDAGAVDLRGFSFVLEFNPAVVTPVAVGPGALLTGAACPDFVQWVNAAAVGDSIYVDGAALGCSMTGPGSLVDLTFALVSHGASSALACRTALLRDGLNHPIPAACVPGLLQTCPGIAVERRAWTQVKWVYR